MSFKIDPKIIEMYPDVKIAGVVCKGLKNPNPELALSYLRDMEERVRDGNSLEKVTEDPVIKDWREAYRAFGKKPSVYRPSLEALVRRVVKGNDLPDISPIVNLYNAVSIRYNVPMGGDDIDALDGDLRLAVADGGEPFLMLGAEDKTAADVGEVIYRDEKEVTCKSWNYRECEKTKVRLDSQNVLLVMEGLENTSKENLLDAQKELGRIVEEIAPGVKISNIYLDKDQLGAQI